MIESLKRKKCQNGNCFILVLVGNISFYFQEKLKIEMSNIKKQKG